MSTRKFKVHVAGDWGKDIVLEHEWEDSEAGQRSKELAAGITRDGVIRVSDHTVFPPHRVHYIRFEEV